MMLRAKESRGIDGATEKESLRPFCAEPDHEIALAERLDALGDHGQLETPRNMHDRLAHRVVGIVARHALHELVANLDAVERQAAPEAQAHWKL